jgi:hypothetical protein
MDISYLIHCTSTEVPLGTHLQSILMNISTTRKPDVYGVTVIKRCPHFTHVVGTVAPNLVHGAHVQF